MFQSVPICANHIQNYLFPEFILTSSSWFHLTRLTLSNFKSRSCIWNILSYVVFAPLLAVSKVVHPLGRHVKESLCKESLCRSKAFKSWASKCCGNQSPHPNCDELWTWPKSSISAHWLQDKSIIKQKMERYESLRPKSTSVGSESDVIGSPRQTLRVGPPQQCRNKVVLQLPLSVNVAKHSGCRYSGFIFNH